MEKSNTTQAEAAQHIYSVRASMYDNSFHPSFAEHIVNSLELKPGERILDLACGTGLVTLLAADAVGSTGSVVGVDITQEMLNELHTKITEAPRDRYKHVTIYNYDITKLHEMTNLMRGTFDAISCTAALSLLREPDVALQNWIEYLKPGGRIIVDVMDVDALPEEIAMERIYHRLGIESPFHRLWLEDSISLRKILQQSGLDVKRTWIMEPRKLGVSYLSIDSWEKKFNAIIHTPPHQALADKGLVQQAKVLFEEEWTKLATHNGKVKDFDGVWIGLAHKPVHTAPVGRGSCACGAIHWTAYARGTGGTNCYCATCRKISGSPYITFVHVPLSRLIFDPPHGKPYMQTYCASPHAERGFCSQCASTLTMWYKEDPDIIAIAVGSLDEDQSDATFFSRPIQNIYLKDLPKWYKLPDDGLFGHQTMRSAGKLLGKE
ncbi:uncharacterized protein PV09_07748 [Verruconis gallopava]|uniref:CENP-V/GFA domain-containing protein n=1 Tax=Verruconis gallopava TaxID=253628 RepID=A0A0D1YIR8_9PEZI|nr:uncharacterized protein PV09_07748 [Verruconis gallopava]KIW00767.1 hypothetical protein PV09_07748 [Verruconis gallopava]